MKRVPPEGEASLPVTRRIAVCVPARNEAIGLPRLLAALAAQEAMDFAVCIHLDGCTDGSADVLAAMAGTLPFPLHVAAAPGGAAPNAGAARRAAMALGLATSGGGADAALLTTDADSRPRPGWVRAALDALASAEVAAGRTVRIGGAGDLVQGRLERYLDRLHLHRRRLDPVPWEAARTCHFSAGANLAFRGRAYLALGGFPPLPHGEDATLLDDAARAGFRVRRDGAMVVETSSRRDGRATGGLAATLRALDEGLVPEVAHPADAAWQYQAHGAARHAFARLDDRAARERLGGLLGLSADHVLGVGRDCPNAEAFAMRVVPAAPGGTRALPLPQAEAALAALERAWEKVPA